MPLLSRYRLSLSFATFFSLQLVSLLLFAQTQFQPLPAVTTAYPDALQQQFSAKLDALGSEYKPRTKHLNADGSAIYTNRLLLESSPYLQQHAHNPVNWYSWSAEALQKAQAENKPIFLSIGYSTCHWCHVMEGESFENEEIAAYLNEHFISIKIDREQLPDIDHTYMLAAAMISGQTGWPLNAFNTPNAEPFFAATYFPPQQFFQMLQRVAYLWQTTHDELQADAAATMASIKRISANQTSEEAISSATALAATEQWLEIADEQQGGFGLSPKFPTEPVLLMLMEQSIRQQDTDLWQFIELTLNAMQQGGIYDQIGGGFHRYATDTAWRVPHFEKMLYNQAQLATVYFRAFDVTGNPLYKRTAVDTLDYVLREMTSASGLFYSATDADSEGEEGTFFLWDKQQIEQLLSPEEATLAKQLYAVDAGSNFSDRNILYLPKSLTEYVIAAGYPIAEFLNTLDQINQRLLNAREQRIHPLKDNKSITSWNSMMIRSLVEASLILDDTKYLDAAINSANALWQKHYQADGLIRDTRAGVTGTLGNLEDYAYFAAANLALFDITAEPKWLERSKQLADEMLELFWEESSDTLYLSRANTLLPVRAKDRGDDAVPAATSVAYELLSQLATRQSDQRYATFAQRVISAISGNVRGNPMQYSYLLKAHQDNNRSVRRVQFGAQGALRAELQHHAGNQYILKIQMQPGWHINAHKPGFEKLIGSQLNANWIVHISYPDSIQKPVSFAPQPISLYSGEMTFEVTANKQQRLDELLTFTYQACSEKQCLAPETMTFSSAIQ